ncbi:MAG: c-type cytochrome domain-containing protein, partial [Verrucomicrobiota bacterium]
MKRFGIVILFLLSAGHAPAGLETVRPFLQQYCFDCHGPEKQKGDYRFDTLGLDLSRPRTLDVWQNILDQLNLGEMPPAKKTPQPPFAETRTVIDTLTATLKQAYVQHRSTGGQAVIRRLN